MAMFVTASDPSVATATVAAISLNREPPPRFGVFNIFHLCFCLFVSVNRKEYTHHSSLYGFHHLAARGISGDTPKKLTPFIELFHWNFSL